MDIESLKKMGVLVLGTSLLACTLFTSNVRADDTYNVTKDTPVYISTTDAKNQQNSISVYSKGKYYIFKEYNGFINISKTKGQPGAWIKATKDNSKVNFIVNEAVFVRSQYNNKVVSVKYAGESFEAVVNGDWLLFEENGQGLKLHASYASKKDTTQSKTDSRTVIESVNVRDAKTNEIVDVKSAGDSLKGNVVNGWVIFNENGKELKVHVSYTKVSELVSLKVVESVNVRDENLNLVGYLSAGETIKGYRSGNYYKFFDNGVKQVWHSYLKELSEVDNQSYKINTYSNTTQSKTSSKNETTVTTNTTTSSSSSSLQNKIVEGARKYLGVKYVWASANPSVGFDCSGLTSYVYKNHAGITLGRNTTAQYATGTPVSRNNLQPGDLVFFGSSRVSHVGIYVGNNKIIHAPTEGRNVEEVSLSNSWYSSNYIGARRIVN